MLGTDSHTCTAGAFGQFATGIGNTDAGFVLGTGKILLKVAILVFMGYSSGFTVMLFDFIANMKFLIIYPEKFYLHFLLLHIGVTHSLFWCPLPKT